jgi:ABC-type lipoprotein release transport system permease subunit
VRFIGYKYVEGRRVVVFVVILVLSSMLFSMMAFSLLGFYRVFGGYLGGANDIVVVYDRNSNTPFTGLIPIYLVENISSIKGVMAVSPEVIVPCVLKNESVFLRGIVPEDFVKLNQLVMVEGSMIRLDDLDSIIVGKNLAERFDLKPGERVLVLSVFVNQYLELYVKGVFVSRSVMDDEILAPLYVGQWLRGTDYNYVTLMRVKVNSSMVDASVIFEAIGAKSSSVGSSGVSQLFGGLLSLSRPSFKIENIGVNEGQKFMESYLSRYGVTKESLIVLSVIVFLLCSVTIVVAFKTILVQHKGVVGILRSIGVSRKFLRVDLLFRLLFWSLFASSIGIVLSLIVLSVMQAYGFLRVLSHTVLIYPDPLIIILNFVLVFVIILLVILRSDLE